MKRILAAILLLAAIAVPKAGPAAPSGTEYRNLYFYWTQGTNVVWFSASVASDLLTQAPVSSFACVGVANGFGSDSACGSGVAILLDPAARYGRATATLLGSFGPIKVDVDFVSTAVHSQLLPWAFVEVVPSTPPSGYATYGSNQLGRSSGTVTSGIGPFAPNLAPASAYYTLNASA